MSKKYATPLRLDIRPSLRLIRFLQLLHLLSVYPVIISQVHWLIKIFLLLALLGNYLFEIKKLQQFHTLIWLEGNDWQIMHSATDFTQARLSPMSFMLGWLVVVILKTANKKTQVHVLPADAMDAVSFRQLKVRLRTLKLKHLRPAAAD